MDTLSYMILFTTFPTWINATIIPGLPLRWYGLMYVLAFLTTYLLFRYQANHGAIQINSDDTQSLFMYAILFLLLGARLFSVLIYNGTSYYWTHPWLIFWPFENGQFVGLPGMSYHGGLVGAVLGVFIYSKKNSQSFFKIADLGCAAIPLGYTFGRLGNFINAELWGRVTSSPFGMIFPGAERFSTNYEWVRDIADKLQISYIKGDLLNLPRHPSQLYEAIFEGIVLFLFLWFVIRKQYNRKYPGYILSWYLIGYGFVRFCIEYFREPDSNLGFIIQLNDNFNNPALLQSYFNISMGQIFCLLMILAGVLLAIIMKKYSKKQEKVKR